MNIETEMINGVGLGIEYFDDSFYGKGLLIDVVFLRFMVTWGN